VQPVIQKALAREGLNATFELGGPEHDKLLLQYPALSQGTGYVAPVITLEFGGRATGEPHQIVPITCYIADHLQDVAFPIASPQVMTIARTFWEKLTAAHVFCAQGRLRGERFARHWHDLAAISRSSYFASLIGSPSVANTVAQHKSLFFSEKDAAGRVINYCTAVTGHLKIVPDGEAKDALARDYAAMLEDEVMVSDALSFDDLLDACAKLEVIVNKVASASTPP